MHQCVLYESEVWLSHCWKGRCHHCILIWISRSFKFSQILGRILSLSWWHWNCFFGLSSERLPLIFLCFHSIFKASPGDSSSHWIPLTFEINFATLPIKEWRYTFSGSKGMDKDFGAVGKLCPSLLHKVCESESSFWAIILFFKHPLHI